MLLFHFLLSLSAVVFCLTQLSTKNFFFHNLLFSFSQYFNTPTIAFNVLPPSFSYYNQHSLKTIVFYKVFPSLFLQFYSHFHVNHSSSSSKGALFVSAKQEIKNITNNGNSGTANQIRRCANTISVRFKLSAKIKTPITISPSDTS